METNEIQSGFERLELEYRNKLQAYLIKDMLGEDAHNHVKQEAWAATYGKRVSDLIDNPGHEDIRDLARAGNYTEAVSKLKALLLEGENA